MADEQQQPAEEIVEEAKNGDKVALDALNDAGPGNWYVLHTYSGYEDAVADSLRQRIESLDMGDKIFKVLVPKEKQIEIKNGKRRTVEKKIFPGYVLVKMIVTEASWYVVRNTPNVTGLSVPAPCPSLSPIPRWTLLKSGCGWRSPSTRST